MTPDEIDMVRRSADTLTATGDARAADLAKVYRALLAEVDRLRAEVQRARADVLRESRSPCCSAAIRCGRCGGDLAYPWPDEAERGGR